MKLINSLLVVVLATMLSSIQAFAHCDSVAGPVAKDVQLALQSGQITPVLKWVRVADEVELRGAFDRALTVRKSGGEAAKLADQFFLETAVRLHRASEGAPYSGLKPATAALEAAPALVDAALETGRLETIQEDVLSQLGVELATRVKELKLARTRMNENAERGREYVRAYVELVHYIERLQTASGTSAHGEAATHRE